MSRIVVVGVGPGDPDLLTLKARDILQAAQVVAGFETVLVPVLKWISGEVVPLRYVDQDARLDDLSLKARAGLRCVLCVWGDVSFSASELISRVRSRFEFVELVPGVSSIQAACAALGLALERCLFITLHSRSGVESAFEEAVDALRHRKRTVILLPRPWDLMPAAAAAELVKLGVDPDESVWVLERLTLPGEEMRAFSAGALARSSESFSDLSIMVFPV